MLLCENNKLSVLEYYKITKLSNERSEQYGYYGVLEYYKITKLSNVK